MAICRSNSSWAFLMFSGLPSSPGLVDSLKVFSSHSFCSSRGHFEGLSTLVVSCSSSLLSALMKCGFSSSER